MITLSGWQAVWCSPGWYQCSSVWYCCKWHQKCKQKQNISI